MATATCLGNAEVYALAYFGSCFYVAIEQERELRANREDGRGAAAFEVIAAYQQLRRLKPLACKHMPDNLSAVVRRAEMIAKDPGLLSEALVVAVRRADRLRTLLRQPSDLPALLLAEELDKIVAVFAAASVVSRDLAPLSIGVAAKVRCDRGARAIVRASAGLLA